MHCFRSRTLAFFATATLLACSGVEANGGGVGGASQATQSGAGVGGAGNTASETSGVISGGAAGAGVNTSAGFSTGGSVALAGAGGASAGGTTAGAGSGGSGGIGSGGNSSAGASPGGAASYNPCPQLPAPCQIMPSGDSITVGSQSTDTGGYRVPLFQTARQHSQTITLIGPSGAGPATVDGVPFPDGHDGHSGYVIDTVGSRKGIAPLMVQNLTKLQPHIVLLMIGTNDINSQVDLLQAPQRLSALIDTITTTAPNTLLVVARLIPTRTDSLNVQVQAFNAQLPGIVSERVKAGKHIVIADMYAAFTANASYKSEWLFDGLHPNDAGYGVMAKTWYAAITAFLR